MGNESEPLMKVHMTNGAEIAATPENTHLFQFMGELASRNHIFIETNHDKEQSRGLFIFHIVQQQQFSAMLQYMVQNDYPIHTNLRQVPETDERAYQQAIEKASQTEAAGLDDELNSLFD